MNVVLLSIYIYIYTVCFSQMFGCYVLHTACFKFLRNVEFSFLCLDYNGKLKTFPRNIINDTFIPVMQNAETKVISSAKLWPFL